MSENRVAAAQACILWEFIEIFCTAFCSPYAIAESRSLDIQLVRRFWIFWKYVSRRYGVLFLKCSQFMCQYCFSVLPLSVRCSRKLCFNWSHTLINNGLQSGSIQGGTNKCVRQGAKESGQICTSYEQSELGHFGVA